ncbi:hypothetical protein ACQKQD_18785 [Methylobacterium sp. NPDC080182]|uniref:hypothetical protein n=1 Tax=Methylobacterium sp. NPDC080182 TaxID=3390590 RepID=UPI003D026248
MYDIDPPSPVLRLNDPRRATQPTLNADRQHLAQREPVPVYISYTLTINAQPDCTAEVIGRIIDRYRTLAQRIDAL